MRRIKPVAAFLFAKMDKHSAMALPSEGGIYEDIVETAPAAIEASIANCRIRVRDNGVIFLDTLLNGIVGLTGLGH